MYTRSILNIAQEVAYKSHSLGSANEHVCALEGDDNRVSRKEVMLSSLCMCVCVFLAVVFVTYCYGATQYAIYDSRSKAQPAETEKLQQRP